MELGGFGRLAERGGRGFAAGYREADRVEIAGADLALVLGGGVALCLGREFRLLQLGIGRHLPVLIAARQLEGGVVQAVEAGQGDELEPVAHCPELAQWATGSSSS